MWTARPVTIVQDSPELIVLYLCPGTSWKLPQGNAFLDLLKAGEWQLRDVIAADDDLILIIPGEAYAVHIMGGRHRGEFDGWYINLQDPIRRTELGFDFMDHALDILVKPDFSGWEWKDEEELVRIGELDIFSTTKINMIWAAGERAIGHLQTKNILFRNGWESWSPPLNWPVPELPEDWDKIF